MVPGGRPEAEVEVDVALVDALVRAQHPDLVGPVRPVASGWDNAMFRLGDDLAVRLPRRALGAELILNEGRWLPELAPLVGLLVPVPVRAAVPGGGYPFPWSIVRWIEGDTALHPAVALDEREVAAVLGRFLLALRSVPPPADAPTNPFRGVPLARRSPLVADRLGRLPPDIDPGPVGQAWESALAAPDWPGPPTWVHGDLHPGNLLVARGRLVGVVDWGDLNAGDPATDLSVAWMLLGVQGRRALRAGVEVDDDTWARARGNALAHAVAVLASSADDPVMEQMGRRTLTAVLGEPPDRR